MCSKIKLGLLDDHTLFRKTITNFLSLHADLEISFQACCLEELLNKLKKCEADILLIDFFMPHVNGLEAIKIIRQRFPTPKILFLSMCTDPAVICSILDEGIYGYISKGDEPEELIQAIKCAHNNKIYRNKIFTEALYWNNKKTVLNGVYNSRIDFDEREKKIIRLLWLEKTNKEIAEEIFLSIRSIEKIRQDMKSKLGVKTTVGLLKYAIHNKIIEINI